MHCCFRTGTEAKRLLEVLGDSWNSIDSAMIELLIDWLQPFKGSSYSVGVAGIRVMDLEDRHRGKAAFVKPLFVIPGKYKPKIIRPYLLRFLLRLKQLHADDDACIKVTERYTDDAGVCHERSVPLKVYLTSILADTPAGKDMLVKMGVGAKLPCNRCKFRATVVANAGGRGVTYYPMGYSEPAEQSDGSYLHVNDPQLKLSHDDQVGHAMSVLAGDMQANEAGCKGLSPFVELLEYVDYNTIHLVPIAHALLYGVVADFVDHALRPYPKPTKHHPVVYPPDIITHAQRQKMKVMSDKISVTSEFGRPYKCVVEHRTSYRMEDWQHFVETFSQVVFGPDLLSPLLTSLWELLVGTVTHYMRGSMRCTYDDPDDVREDTRVEVQLAMEEAADNLRRFADTVQASGMPANLCTLNLHILVCNLPDQESARGPSGKDLEYVVERLMQYFKKIVGGRRSTDPEKVFINKHLLISGITRMQQGDSTLRQALLVTDGSSNSKTAGSNLDIPLDDCVLYGSGKPLPTKFKSDVFAALQRYIRVSKPSGWAIKHAHEAVMRGRSACYKYSKAEINEGQFTGRSYGTARTRPNYWALVAYSKDDDDEIDSYVVTLKYFIKVHHPRRPCEYLRLAVTDMYAMQTRHGRAHRADVSKPKWRNYMVPITQINDRLCCYYPNGYEKGMMYFMQYENISKL
jgi:hypothetical protein